MIRCRYVTHGAFVENILRLFLDQNEQVFPALVVLRLGYLDQLLKAIPQDKISINQSINPSRESIISTQKDALRFPLYQRHGISNIPPIFYPTIAPKNVPTKPQRLPDLLPARRPRQSTPSLSFLSSSLLSFILPLHSRPLPRVPHRPLPRHTPN